MKTATSTYCAEFCEQGFVVIDNLVTPKLLARIRQCVDGISRNYAKLEAGLKERVYLTKPDGASAEGANAAPRVRLISDAGIFGGPFQQLIFHPPLLEAIESLLGTSEFEFRYSACRVRHAGERAGKFHREASPFVVTAPQGLVCIVPLEEMSAENGGTRFVRHSHRLGDEEVMQSSVAEKLLHGLDPSAILSPRVPAGSALFFDYKIIHSTGPMSASARARRTVLAVWEPEGTRSTRAARFAYDGLRPRSQLSEYQRQMRMAFPHLGAKSLA